MAVAHAAVLAQGQAFAGQLQPFLALVFAFACFQALGGLGMGTPWTGWRSMSSRVCASSTGWPVVGLGAASAVTGTGCGVRAVGWA
jgi:hypothetical protein